MSFSLYLHAWMCEYPHLDAYYHLPFIEQAYQEEFNHVN